MQGGFVVQELLVRGAFGRVHVGDVAAEGSVFGDGACMQRSLENGVESADFAVNFATVRAEIGAEALRITAVRVATALVVRVHPRFYARVFQVPVPKCAAELKAIAGNADRGGPLVAPPAVIEHACGGLHVVPQEFSVKFPMRNRLHAQIERERNVVLVALQVLLEYVRNERNHVGPFKFAASAIGVFVRIRFFFSGASVKGGFRKT